MNGLTSSPRVRKAAHKPSVTVVFPDDLCAAEINICDMRVWSPLSVIQKTESRQLCTAGLVNAVYRKSSVRFGSVWIYCIVRQGFGQKTQYADSNCYHQQRHGDTTDAQCDFPD